MKSLTLNQRQKNITLAAVFTAAGVVYALISLVNHYLFKTYALDLGLYTHAMYDYAHFRIDDCSMFLSKPQSILSAHFDLYLLLLSPLTYLFGTYTLLIVQIAAVLFGGWGIYKLISLYSDDDLIPFMATLVFFSTFGIIHALSYDYHSNVVSAMMMPWMLYYLKKGRLGLSSLFAVLLVIGKENLSLWLFFIALGLMWDYRKDRKSLWYLTGCALFAAVYFIVVNMLILPRLGARGIMRYEYLGSNYFEIAKTLITKPIETLRILFINTSSFPHYDGIKAEFYICVLLTGMALTILKPNYLFMLIPLIAQKMLSTDRLFWGISLQYTIEFMPVLVISSFLVIIKLKKVIWQEILAAVLLISTVLTTFYTIGIPKSYVKLDQICIYQKRHYEQKEFDVRYVRDLIKQIPKGASVCASTMFVPHLCMRPEIYDYQSVASQIDAEFVLVTEPHFNMPLDNKAPIHERDDYQIVSTNGEVFLLKKKPLEKKTAFREHNDYEIISTDEETLLLKKKQE